MGRGGWYKSNLYFSHIQLEGSLESEITLVELIEIVEALKLSQSRIGFRVRVENTITGVVNLYPSKKAAAAAMNADETSFGNRKGLFRKVYKISLISKFPLV